MSDYKLVPYDPAPEMVEAAKDAYMPFGDMDLALRMAILAAPAVQEEPVGWVWHSYNQTNFTSGSHHKEVLEADGVKLTPVYTTPQPAEQQPCPEGIREGAPYDDPAFESLCREHEVWGTAAAAQCAVFWEAGKRVAEQQPAPDVAGLVEALEKIAAFQPKDILCGSGWKEWNRAGEYAASIARAALAAHRSRGEV